MHNTAIKLGRQLGQLFVVATLIAYGLQVVDYDLFKSCFEVDVLELVQDTESDSEELQSGEDLDDHLSQRNFSRKSEIIYLDKRSYYINKYNESGYFDPGYPPPEII